jgi:hypothetical protein
LGDGEQAARRGLLHMHAGNEALERCNVTGGVEINERHLPGRRQKRGGVSRTQLTKDDAAAMQRRQLIAPVPKVSNAAVASRCGWPRQSPWLNVSA